MYISKDMNSTLLKLPFFILLIFISVNCVSQIDAPVHKEIRTYYVNDIPSVAAYSDHYGLRPLTFPLDEEEDVVSFIWESDSTFIIKTSKQHIRLWAVEMIEGLITLDEVMYGEDKYPNQTPD